MKFRLLPKKKAAEPAARGQAIVLSINSNNRGLDFLAELFQQIRPADVNDKESAELKFKAFLFQLQEDRSLLFSLRKALLSQFAKSDLSTALTESGLLSSRGFIQELGSKIKHKIIPALLQPEDFLFVIERIFYKRDDYVWMEKIDSDLWKLFFQRIGIEVNLNEPELNNQLLLSMQTLSYRLAMMGLEKEITRLHDAKNDAVFPFLEQNRLINLLIERKKNTHSVQDEKTIAAGIYEALHNCLQSIRFIKEHRRSVGTSLAETFLLTRMEQHVERLLLVLDAIDNDNRFDIERFIIYFITVVRNQNRKNSVSEFLSQNLGLLAYQISEHGGRRGETFITKTRTEFAKLFIGAMGGGVIISFIAIFKNLLVKVSLAPFWQAVAYSTNYSIGFLLIQSTGSTLATKQPAFTASAVASSLDSTKLKGRPDLDNLAVTVSQVSRSQLASFAGNLLIVFPLTYLLAMLFYEATGSKIAAGDEALALLQAQHPFQSLALLFACFTGFFLFLSGLIAGWVENYVVYAQLPQRIQLHPVLHHSLGKKQLKWLVNMVENKLGSIAGSVSLGFFLGMAAFIGKTFGIPFDIRHITISAGNTAIGYFGLEEPIDYRYLGIILLGVSLIGFLNFFVSFGFAFYVAVKSRGIRLKDYPEFLGILWRYFRKRPMDFIMPPKK
jgi:site-specific recombinase